MVGILVLAIPLSQKSLHKARFAELLINAPVSLYPTSVLREFLPAACR